MIEELRKFTYQGYEHLLKFLRTKYDIIPVQEAREAKKPYLILTHSADWSLKASYKMAEIDNDLGVRATFFILFSNKLYNVLEKDNLDRLREISKLGHEIALHYDMKAYREYGGDINDTLMNQATLLESLSGSPVRSICMHQPAIETGDPFVDHPSFINVAKPSLYELYVVDSYRAWSKSHLKKLLALEANTVRLSIHPGLWGYIECNREDAIKKILDDVDRENRDERVRQFSTYWYTHPKVRDFDSDASEEDIEQTLSSFVDKWRYLTYKAHWSADKKVTAFAERFSAILGVETIEEVGELLKDGMNMLDVGCGLAYPEHLFNLNPNVNRYAIDLSESAVEISRELTKDMENVIIEQADLFDLPFEKEFFDIIFAEGVLHHTGDARRAFSVLCEHLRVGGLIGIYVYCVKPVIRELVDREIRKLTTAMSIRRCEEFAKQITSLGRSLRRIDDPLVITESVPLLNIKAGTYNLQKFIYDHFIKCFYNETFGPEYSKVVNIDWYHPKSVTHHTSEEIAFWFKENNIENVNFIQPKGWEHSGYFVSGRKTGSF